MAPPPTQQAERVGTKVGATAAEKVIAAPTQTGAKKHAKALQSKMMINTYITNAAETGDPEVLLETIGQHLASMNDINLATALHRVAKLSTRRDSKDLHLIVGSPMLKQLYDAVAQRILGHGLRKGSGVVPSAGGLAGAGGRGSEMPVQCMGVIAWSCAMMKLCDTELFDAICEIAAPRMHEFQPFELAQLLWSFAKISMPAPALFEAAARRMLLRQEGEFKGLCLAMTAWAFAASNVRNEALYNSLSVEIVQHASDLRPQELANTLWAFAQMQIHCPMLFETLGWAVSSKVKALRTQELTDVLWAFGAAGQPHPGVFSQASPVVSQKRGLLTPQSLASLAWAYEKLRVPELQHVLPSLLETAAGKFSKFQACDLCTLLVAGMHAEMVGVDYLSRLARHCSHKLLQEMLRTMETRSLLDMLTVWLHANLPPPKLFDDAVQELSRRCASLDVPALLDTLRCALSVSMKPHLASRTGTAWITAVSDELARCVARLTAADVDTVRVMLSEFCESPGMSAVLPLQIALGHACSPKLSPKLQPKFDSETTVVSTMCPSDYNVTEERESVTKQLLNSVMNPAEDDVWRSIRKQSNAKEKARIMRIGSAAPHAAMLSDAKAGSPVVHVTSTALPGPVPRYEVTKVIGTPPGLVSTCGFADVSMDSLFVDEIPDHDTQNVAMNAQAPASLSLSDWLVQHGARGGKMTCTQAARLALGVLGQADEAAARLGGAAALRAVSCDAVWLEDEATMAASLRPDASAAAGGARHADLTWLSPEEAVGSVDDAQATWAALSYRVGLLLHCAAVSGSSEPYPHRSADSVICGLLRSAKGCGQPEEPFGLGSASVGGGSPTRCRLMENVISSCLRLSRPGAPDRAVVETSLAILSQEANRLSV